MARAAKPARTLGVMADDPELWTERTPERYPPRPSGDGRAGPRGRAAATAAGRTGRPGARGGLARGGGHGAVRDLPGGGKAVGEPGEVDGQVDVEAVEQATCAARRAATALASCAIDPGWSITSAGVPCSKARSSSPTSSASSLPIDLANSGSPWSSTRTSAECFSFRHPGRSTRSPHRGWPPLLLSVQSSRARKAVRGPLAVIRLTNQRFVRMSPSEVHAPDRAGGNTPRPSKRRG